MNDPVRVLESMLARAKEDKNRIDSMRGTLPVTYASMHKIIVGRIGALQEALKVIRNGEPLREMGDGRDTTAHEQEEFALIGPLPDDPPLTRFKS